MNTEFQKYLDEALPKITLDTTPTKFKITIEEVITDDFWVEAETMEEAMEIAQNNYYSGEFVLEPGSLVAKQMMATDRETEKTTEWVEF